MNASDADRPESNENVPEPPVPSQPSGNAGDSASSETRSNDSASNNTRPGKTSSSDARVDHNEADGAAKEKTGAQVAAPIRPAEGQSVDEPSVTFEWERVEAADNYQLQIAKDREFTEMVFDARVGASSAFTYSGLPPQEGFTLYWRVRAHIREEESWTDFGTVGTFVLADWRPEQPALARAHEASVPVADADVADADVADSSRAEPVLITFAIAVTVIAVWLSIVYMQTGGFVSTAEEPEVAGTADADSVSLDLEAPVPNEDGETYRISINDAMRQVVRERGGTWEASPSDNDNASDNVSDDAPTEGPPRMTEQPENTPNRSSQDGAVSVEDTSQERGRQQEDPPTPVNDTL